MLVYTYFYSELFALIGCVYTYKKLDNNFKIFLPFLIFIVVYELANIYDLLLWHHTNTWCANIEEMVELVVYGQFMASLDKRKAYRQKVYIAISACVIIAIADMFFIQGFWALNTVAIVIQKTTLTILVCIYYYNLLNNSDEYPDLLNFPPFFATMGLLLYSLTNFFYFAFFSYMIYVKNYHFFIVARVISEISCVFIYSLLAISFLCFLKTKKLS
jgi:hypothetical protein